MDHVEVLHPVGNLEVASRVSNQLGNAKASNFPLLHYVIGGVELGAFLLDELSSFCERGLTPITHERVINQVLALVKVVVDLPPKCATLLLGTTNCILSNLHPRHAKAHVLEIGVAFGPLGPSCALGNNQWLVLEQ
jgi:hypothetical protein